MEHFPRYLISKEWRKKADSDFDLIYLALAMIWLLNRKRNLKPA